MFLLSAFPLNLATRTYSELFEWISFIHPKYLLLVFKYMSHIQYVESVVQLNSKSFNPDTKVKATLKIQLALRLVLIQSFLY